MALFYAYFGTAVDCLEVRSASAARVDGKEIRPFVDWFVEDNFCKRHVGLHNASARNLDIGAMARACVQALLQPDAFIIPRRVYQDVRAGNGERMPGRYYAATANLPVEYAVDPNMVCLVGFSATSRSFSPLTSARRAFTAPRTNNPSDSGSASRLDSPPERRG